MWGTPGGGSCNCPRLTRSAHRKVNWCNRSVFWDVPIFPSRTQRIPTAWACNTVGDIYDLGHGQMHNFCGHRAMWFWFAHARCCYVMAFWLCMLVKLMFKHFTISVTLHTTVACVRQRPCFKLQSRRPHCRCFSHPGFEGHCIFINSVSIPPKRWQNH